MTPTEKALIKVLNNLVVAVSDLQFAQQTASKALADMAGDSPSAYQQDLAGYLSTASQQLQTVRSLLSQLEAQP